MSGDPTLADLVAAQAHNRRLLAELGDRIEALTALLATTNTTTTTEGTEES